VASTHASIPTFILIFQCSVFLVVELAKGSSKLNSLPISVKLEPGLNRYWLMCLLYARLVIS